METSPSTDLRRWQLTPRQYRRVSIVALALLCIIVVSGAAVRLTGSGLGCDDWPNCNNERLIDVSSTHAAIEQINRLFTGLVALGVIVAVLGSLVRVPRRRDLTWWSLGLVAGVIAQIVLGGITVLVDLHPLAVQGHFLLSMVLVANAMILVHRSADPVGPRRPVVDAGVRRHVRLVIALTAVVLVAGTVLTGAGPHAGDERARRFDLSISMVARVHGALVWITVASVVALAYRLRRSPAQRAVLEGPITAWLCVGLLQAGVGYVQYLSGVPAVLVGFHIAGATALWTITVWMREVMWAVQPVSADATLDPDERATASPLHA